MTKDHENVSLPLSADDLDLVSGPKPFAADQMVACGKCLRSNPPTRVNCLYCGAALPLNEASLSLQKPTLRRLEKWELGYNNILIPSANALASLAEADLSAAADILKLSNEDLRRLIEAAEPIPVAQAATSDEATLVERRLANLGLKTRVVADAELGVSENGSFTVRWMELSETGFSASSGRDTKPIEISWSQLVLIVLGRIVSRRVELQEEKSSRQDDRILDSSEFFSDEAVIELHVAGQPRPFRISANNFDFSCLGQRKALVAGENMKTMVQQFRESAPNAIVDDNYKSLRKLLEPVWPHEQQNASSGWRRERPGKYSVGSVTLKNNDNQFMRYSLLRAFLLREGQQ